MVATVDGLFGVVILAGITVAALGLYSYRRWDQVGIAWLAAAGVLLGLSGVSTGVTGIVLGAAQPEGIQPLWAGVGFMIWATASVPWLVFVLQYTGRYTEMTWRIVGSLYLPILLALSSAFVYRGDQTPGLVDVLVSISFIYSMGLVFIGAFLLVQATSSYVHLSVTQSVGLSVLPVVLVLALNSVQMIQSVSVTASVTQYAVVLVVGTVGWAVALVHRPLLAWTPAVETIGDRAIARETDDLVLVVDENDYVVKCNESVTDVLALDRGEVLGTPVETVLGHDSDELVDYDTVPLQTETGRDLYDPQISTITHGTDTPLGTVLSLRDVTERELREQRLAVLNRVLRHNLRNKVDVIQSNAEVLQEEADGDYASTIADTAESLAELGNSARTIDQFVSESLDERHVDLVERIDRVLTAIDANDHDVTVDLEMPDSSRVVTNPEALDGALESAIDNAVSYAESNVEITVRKAGGGYELVVRDDGPGIPQNELDSLDAGSETPLRHGTGLGLWQLKWAVTTMGGELEFDTTDGTIVTVRIPDQTDDEIIQTG